MADERFDLIFRGDIVLGQPLHEVKQRLQQLFKADEARIERLFTGRPVTLRRQLDEPTARKYQKALHNAGALVEKVPAVEQASAEAAAPQGLSLAPRGGQLLKPSERTPPAPAPVLTAQLTLRPPEGPLLDRDEVLRVEAVDVIIPELELAPVGSDLGQQKQHRTPVAPDISGLRLADRP